MHKALMWKEWREQRPLVLTGLLVTALMPFFLMAGLSVLGNRSVNFLELSEASLGLYALLLWPLFAAAAGAGTVATEIGDGTLGFLLSRPVSRLRVWLVKVTLAAAAFALVVLCSLLVSWFLRRIGGGDGIWALDVFDMELFPLVPLLGLLAGGVLVTFSAAVFFSTILSRAMTAAAAALVAALTLVSGIYLVWSKIELVPSLEPQWMVLETAFVAVLILLASLYLFSRGEMLRGKGARKTALVAAALALLGAGVVGLPVVFASVQVSAQDASFNDAFLSPSGDAVVASVSRASGASPQVWLVPTDGSRFQRLTGRLTLAPALSPDGEWLAYVSLRGAMGTRRSGAAQIRVRRLDGRDDRSIGSWPDVEGDLRFGPPRLEFSPDGSRVLVSRWHDTARVYSVAGKPAAEIALKGTPLEGTFALHWSPDGSEVLVNRAPSEERSGSMVGAVNPDAGRTRVIFETDGDMRPAWLGGWTSEAVLLGSSLAVIVYGETPRGTDDFHLSLLDLNDGSLRPIMRSSCWPRFGVHRDEGSIVYATCPDEAAAEDDVGEVHRWRSDGSDEVLLPKLDLKLTSISLSPAGDRVVFRNHDDGVRVLDPDGTLRDLDFSGWWTLLGWAGKDRLVALDAYDPDPGVFVLNIISGEQREVFLAASD